jgi:glyoxylase-like metal-dependent hydrolase (beta-lactamase superfamily II)
VSSSAPEPLRLRLPLPFPIGGVNAYLLRGDPLTLVDPGLRWPQGLAALEAALAEQRLRVEDIELVVVTHQHVDHAGLAETIRQRAGCSVAAHELVAEVLRDEPASRVQEEAYAVALMALHGVSPEIAQTVPAVSQATSGWTETLVVDRVLHDGDELVAGGRAFTVRPRPGHSPTDTLFIASDGVALVADHLLLRHSVALLAHRPPGGSDDPRERPRALLDYRRSLAATARDQLRIAYPGHGDHIDDLAAVIAQRLATQEERAPALLPLLRGAPRTAWEVTSALSDGSAPGDEQHPMAPAFIAFSNVLAQLDLLVDRGDVRELDDGERIRFAATAP